jgi:hypothetical protein
MNFPKDIGLGSPGSRRFLSSLDHPIHSSSPRGILVQMHHQRCKTNLPSDIPVASILYNNYCHVSWVRVHMHASEYYA